MTVQPEEPQKRTLIATILAALDAVESSVSSAVDAGVRRFLNRAKDIETLGEMYGWWGAEVDGTITNAIREAWLQASIAYSGPLSTTSLDGLETYMSRVKDRLVRGLDPPLPQAAFDQVRLSITTGAAHGWSTDRVSQDIAARLSWETRGSYWREQKSEVDQRIDSILDPLGEPGTPAREWAKMHDPTVQALRDQRNFAIDRLDDEQSYWKTRATMIARTESTGAFNAAALQSLTDEGWAYKQWLATDDSRTRPSHRLADGQRVKLGVPFIVGGVPLMMPGDPTGAPEEVINCRCVLIGTDEEPSALELVASGFKSSQARVPKGNGELSGRWIPMPWVTIRDLVDHFGGNPVVREAGRNIEKLQESKDLWTPETARLLNRYADALEQEMPNIVHPSFPGDAIHLKAGINDLRDFASVDWYSDPDFDPNHPPREVPATLKDVEDYLAAWQSAYDAYDVDHHGEFGASPGEAVPGDILGHLEGGSQHGASLRIRWEGKEFVAKEVGADDTLNEEAGSDVANALGFNVAARGRVFKEVSGLSWLVAATVGDVDGSEWYRQQPPDLGGGTMGGAVAKTFGMQSFKMAVLDAVTNNGDRNSGNWRVGNGDTLYPIDMNSIDLGAPRLTETLKGPSPYSEFFDFWFPKRVNSYYDDDYVSDAELDKARAELPAMRKSLEGLHSEFITDDQKKQILARFTWVENRLAEVKTAGGIKTWLKQQQ